MAGRAVVIHSLDQARADFPQVAACAVIYCGGRAGDVMATLRLGLERVCFTGKKTVMEKLPAPAPAPESAAEPQEPPEPDAADPASPDAVEEDTWSGFAIAPAPAAVGSLPAVPPPPKPPAPEETSLATVPPEPPAAPETAARETATPAVEPGAEPLQAGRSNAWHRIG